jgi:Fic-DOC domain mobile mystery protein B
MGSAVNDWQPIAGETPIDPSGLKDRSITTRRDLNRAEALNIAKAHVKYLAAAPTSKLAPFDYDWFLRLHREMYCDVWTWAGRPRQVDLNLGVPWAQVSEQVLALTRDLPCWAESGASPAEQAARLHYRAVWIHPFHNGNGRWARLLANVWLRRQGAPLILWPEETIGQESVIRDCYIKALRDADNGDLGPLLALHAKYAARTGTFASVSAAL